MLALDLYQSRRDSVSVPLLLVGLLCLLVVLASIPDFRNRYGETLRRSRTASFIFVMLAALLWSAMPALRLDFLNPDEAFFAAAARKLAVDPVFYRSVDTGTSGPLNIYPLVLPALFHAPVTYESARLTATWLMFGTLLCLYLAYARFLGSRAGALMLLPVLSCVLFFRDPEFLHYSSERVPLFLSAVALLTLSYELRGQARYSPIRMALTGLLVVGMVFAKLQAVPMAAVLFLAALVLGLPKNRSRSWKPVASLIGGALILPITLLGIFLNSGVFAEFYRSYVEQNLAYSDRTGKPLWIKLLWVATPLNVEDLKWHYFGLLAFFVVLVILLIRRRHVLSFAGESRELVLFAAAFLLASIYAIAKPGNKFEHYLLFLLVPVSLFGAVVAKWLGQQIFGVPTFPKVAAFLILTVVLPSYMRATHFEHIGYERKFDPQKSFVARLISQFAREGDRMVVWGWKSELYIQTGLLQGTRFGDSIFQIDSPVHRSFFREQYLRDFKASTPPVFVDAVGPGQFNYVDRATAGHEVFPELDSLIRADYAPVADVDGLRIYVRKDRLAAVPQLTGRTQSKS